MTRLARGDVEMGVGIAATNAAALAERLRDLRAVINGWLDDLDAASAPPDGPAAGVSGSGRAAVDPEPLRRRFATARDRLVADTERGGTGQGGPGPDGTGPRGPAADGSARR
jgi:hypothetical protein